MTTASETELARKKCVPCEGGVPPLSADEAKQFLESVQGWTLSEDGRRIQRTWVARNFATGIEFFNQVAALAEREGHHPDLMLEGYRNVTVETTTHAIGGLTENDFILAAKINEIPIQVRG